MERLSVFFRIRISGILWRFWTQTCFRLKELVKRPSSRKSSFRMMLLLGVGSEFIAFISETSTTAWAFLALQAFALAVTVAHISPLMFGTFSKMMLTVGPLCTRLGSTSAKFEVFARQFLEEWAKF